MMRYVFIFLVLLTLGFSSLKAGAQETSGSFKGGSVKIGYDNRTCSGALEGSIRYNSSILNVEFCDGTSWVAPGGGSGFSCTAPSTCPNIGDICGDTSQFAGFMIYTNSTCEPLFVTNTNQSTGSEWIKSVSNGGPGPGTDDISTDDFIDGKVNHANRSGLLTDFPAFDLCESNTYHTKSDWYLPAVHESMLLRKNRAAIDANAAQNFSTGKYWTSTEDGLNVAFNNEFGNGDPDQVTKTISRNVRCVRRN